MKRFSNTAALLPAVALLLAGGTALAAAPRFHPGVCATDADTGIQK